MIMNNEDAIVFINKEDLSAVTAMAASRFRFTSLVFVFKTDHNKFYSQTDLAPFPVDKILKKMIILASK